MPEQAGQEFEYWVVRAAETHFFRVLLDKRRQADGPMFRLVGTEWQGTVYNSLAHFRGVQPVKPEKVATGDVPGGELAGGEAR